MSLTHHSGASSRKLLNYEWRQGHIDLMTMQLHSKFRDRKGFVQEIERHQKMKKGNKIHHDLAAKKVRIFFAFILLLHLKCISCDVNSIFDIHTCHECQA